MLAKLFLKLEEKIEKVKKILETKTPDRLGFFLATKLFVLELFLSFTQYLLILLHTPSQSFKILIGQSNLQVCPYSFVNHKKFQKKVRIFSVTGFFALISATVIASLTLNLFLGPIQQSKAATYTFVQTSWSGGATANNASHTSNQTGWTEYSAKDANFTAVNGGADLQLAIASNSITQTSDTDFSGGSQSQTTYSGTGASASETLSYASPGTKQIANGYSHSCALKTDGTVYCWGLNGSGQLGDNTATQRNTPVQVLGVGASGFLTGVSQISEGENHSCAVKTDGTVYCWGYNSSGQLGDNTITSRSTPVQVLGVGASGFLTGVSQIAIGYSSSCAVKTDGTVYCWGYNSSGQLGDNTITSRSTPVQVLGVGASGFLTGVSQISEGDYHSCALKTDGTAFCWGYNGFGQLGDNTITNRSTPVQVLGVGASGFLTGVSQVSVGSNHSYALKTDGTVYYWGYNGNGQLGDNTITNRWTPVQVLGVGASGFLTGVSQIGEGENHSCAVKTDGTVYCWGLNGNAQLGDNTATQRNTPVQVLGVGASGFLTGVSQISEGDYHSCAVKIDGTAFCWGYNANGQIGDNTVITPRWTPVQVLGVGASGVLNLNVYNSSGTFTSRVDDTTANTSFGTLSLTATTPTSTSITIKARSGNQANMSDATAWASCTNITSGSALSTGSCVTNGHRYIQFQATLSTTDTTQTPTLSDVSITYNAYPSSQTLTSSPYNSTDIANVIGTLAWTEDTSLPTGTTVTTSLRTASSSAGLTSASWNDFTNGTTNCAKTTGTVTCSNSAIPAGLKDGTGDQWLQYKVTLTSTGANTPTFSDATIQYVVNAPPQFDTSFNTTGTTATQNSDGTVTVQYQIRDPDTTTGTATPNAITPSFEYSVNGGGAYSNITSSYLGASDLTNKTVGESSYTLYSATWNPKNQLGSSTYVTNAKVRVTINDNEAANNTANAATSNFTLDTTNPTSPSIVISTNNNASAPGSATLTLSASDNSSLQMKVGLTSDLSDAVWETYATSKAITLATDPDTVYAQFKDAYGNTTSIVSTTTPETPAGMMIQDTSNLNFSPAEYRLFAAWKVIANPTPGFAKYLVYRSTSPSSGFSRIDNDTLTSRTINYYGDSSVTFDTDYYYKVASLDSNNNISFLSETIHAKANGAQDAGEGGGGSDGTGPVISSVASSNPQTTSVTITWTTNEISNSTAGYSTDTSFTTEQGVSSYVTAHSVTLTGLTPNTAYKYQVKSTDPTGNLTTDNNSSAGYTFTTSNGPAISNVTIKKIDNTQASITWQTDTDSDTSVTYGTSVSNGSIQSPTTSADTSLIGGSTPFTHTKTLSNLTADTTYYFSVSSTDSSNNTGRDTNGGDFYSFLTTTDNADPVISNLQVSVSSDTEVVLTWTTDEPTKSTIQYGTTSGGPYTSVSQTTYDTAHYAVLSSLTADTKYFYKITATDINGNDTATTERNFTTGVNPDEDHDPLSEITDVSVPSATLTDIQALITFTTDQPSLCVIESGTASGNYTNSLYYEDGYTEKENYNKRHSVIMNNLLFSTLYYYQITCLDNLDTTISSAEYSFTTTAQVETDTEDPDISKVKVKDISGESVTVTWDTDEEGNSLVKYGVTTDYGSMAGDDTVSSDIDNFTKSHKAVITGLIPSTKYYFTAISYDPSGNIAESSQKTFTTTSPSSLTSIKVLSKTLGEALISWKTSKETTSIAEYGKDEDYGEKKESANLTKTHELTLSKLDAGETYHFRVKGTDKDKNLYASNDYTFIPKSPPKIESKKAEKAEEHTANIQFTTDVLTDALITYTNKDNKEETGSQGNPKNETSHTVTLKNLTPGTTYQTKIKARDTEGNESETDGPEFTTGKDENPPQIDQIRTDSALTQSEKVQTIISWITDEPATTNLLYKEGRNGEEKEIKPGNQYTISHIVVLTSFKPGTVYYFKAKSVDQSENIATSTEYALLTPKRKENIVQVIVNNFQDIFGWMR